MNKYSAFLLAGLVACATDPRTGDDQGDDCVEPTTAVSTVAGSGEPGYKDGNRCVARFTNPVNCAYRDGKIYVADFDNGKIRVVDAATGDTSTLINQQGFQKPFGMTFAPDGTLYVSTDKNPQGQQNTMSGSIWRISVGAKTAQPLAVGIGRPRGLTFYNG